MMKLGATSHSTAEIVQLMKRHALARSGGRKDHVSAHITLACLGVWVDKAKVKQLWEKHRMSELANFHLISGAKPTEEAR